MTDPQDNERLLRSGLRDLAGQASFQPIYPTAVKGASRRTPWRAMVAGAIGVGAAATALIVAFAVGGAGVHPVAPGAPARSAELVGTSWTVTEIDGKPVAITPAPTVVFTKNGRPTAGEAIEVTVSTEGSGVTITDVESSSGSDAGSSVSLDPATGTATVTMVDCASGSACEGRYTLTVATPDPGKPSALDNALVVQSSAGCAQYVGLYAPDGAELVVQTLWTLGCDAAKADEQAFVDALASVTKISRDAHGLVAYGWYGGKRLRLVPAGPAPTTAPVPTPVASPTTEPSAVDTPTPSDSPTTVPSQPITLLGTSWLVTHVDGEPAPVPETRVAFFESDLCWAAQDVPGGTASPATCTATPPALGLAPVGVDIQATGPNFLFGVIRGYGMGFTYTQDGANIHLAPFDGAATKEQSDEKAAAGFDALIPGYTTQALTFMHALQSAASFTGDATGLTVFDVTGTERLRLVPAD